MEDAQGAKDDSDGDDTRVVEVELRDWEDGREAEDDCNERDPSKRRVHASVACSLIRRGLGYAQDAVDVHDPAEDAVAHVERPGREDDIWVIPEDPSARDRDDVRDVQSYTQHIILSIHASQRISK